MVCVESVLLKQCDMLFESSEPHSAAYSGHHSLFSHVCMASIVIAGYHSRSKGTQSRT